jgi:hypothetical protein
VARATYLACVLQYSDESFFSVANTTISAISYPLNSSDVVDMASMNATRSKLMSQLTVEAAASSLRWSYGSDPYTESQGMLQEIYGFTQCTRDLNASECIRCFTDFVPSLWVLPTIANKSYGALYGYNCYMRFQVGDPIAPITIFPVAKPPQLPPSPKTPLIPGNYN